MNNNEYKIIIHYVGEKGDPAAFAHAHTHGMELYGAPNLCIPYYVEPEEAAEVLNTVSRWILEEGDDFAFTGVHSCDDEEGNVLWTVSFWMIVCCDELCVLVNILDENGQAPTAWMKEPHEDLGVISREDLVGMINAAQNN